MPRSYDTEELIELYGYPDDDGPEDYCNECDEPESKCRCHCCKECGEDAEWHLMNGYAFPCFADELDLREENSDALYHLMDKVLTKQQKADLGVFLQNRRDNPRDLTLSLRGYAILSKRYASLVGSVQKRIADYSEKINQKAEA
jgi:hypothetical protein